MFGIPGAAPSGDSGAFLGRIQYDARSGFFTNVDRVQGAEGWENKTSEPYRGPAFAVDFGSMEAGYIKMSSPPVFLLVPFLGEGRTIYPPQPEEMTQGTKPGEKAKKAFQPGFRVKVMSQKTFGDAEPRYFSGTSKSLMGSMVDLYAAFVASPEATAGKIPLVKHDSTKTIESKGQFGTSKNFAPVFVITGWIERPAAFGDRICPPPSGMTFPPFTTRQTAPAAPPPVPQAAPVEADALPF